MTEEWRPLPEGYGPYDVSSVGHVRNRHTLRVLKPETFRTGHLRVQLYVSPGHSRHFQVHRLVARAFLGASDLDVLHWNDDPTDNQVGNLRYGSDSDNWWDGVRNGRRRAESTCPEGHPYPTEAGRIIRRCYSCERVAQRVAYRDKVKAGLEPLDPRHGSYAGYRAGCRLACCLDANSKYKAAYYLRRKAQT